MRRVAACLLLLAAVATAAETPAERDRDAAVEVVKALVEAQLKAGLEDARLAAGTLPVVDIAPEGGEALYPFILRTDAQAERRYTLMGVCAGCTRLGLVVEDEAGAVVALDMDDDAVPVVRLKAPRWNGEMRVRVRVLPGGCAAPPEPCVFGLAVFGASQAEGAPP